MDEPLCGWQWFQQHRRDYSQQDIDNLTIVISSKNMKLPAIRAGTAPKTVRDILKDIKRR